MNKIVIIMIQFLFCFVFYSVSLADPDAKTEVLNFSKNQITALGSLRKYYQNIADNGGWQEWRVGKKIMPNDSDERIAILRNILAITGDYKLVESKNINLFDDDLVVSVKKFQVRHGLNDDGVLGKTTQTALSISAEKRIMQIDATIARLENSAELTDNKFILVNLPAYRLYGINQGKTTLDMRVIIGSIKNHTPVFDNHITDVVFNPAWHVPARIVRNEMIPKLIDNPEYFIKAGFTITQDGVAVDPENVDMEKGNLSFKQNSGAGNALGKIKFNMPDSDDIYLHSTANPNLFSKEYRALSHGCIRLEKPRDLAYFVMQNEASWSKEKIDELYDKKSLKQIEVTEVPVHLVYWTAFADENGTAYFYDDVYKKDLKIKNAIHYVMN